MRSSSLAIGLSLLCGACGPNHEMVASDGGADSDEAGEVDEGNPSTNKGDGGADDEDSSSPDSQSDEASSTDTGSSQADEASDEATGEATDENGTEETSTESADDSEGEASTTGSDDADCCIKPNHVSQDELDSVVLDFYRYWKQTYVKPAGSTDGGFYIASSGETGSSDGTITVSEAQGFGMIIVALMAKNAASENDEAREIFDGLYRFFRDHPSDASDDLMSWEVLGDGQGGEQTKKTSTATDGDIDIAYALLLALSHWGSSGDIDYMAAALRVLDAMPGHNVGLGTKRTTLGSWNDESLFHTRSSDWMTGEFHAFAEAAGDGYWDEVADTSYSMAKATIENYSPNTGLVPDFLVNEDPEPAEPNFLEFEYDGEYYNNACRVPLRIMTDVRHYEHEFATEWMELLADWVDKKTGGDPSKIVGGYYIGSGEEIRGTQFPAFTAPFVAAATVNEKHQEFVNRGWDVISVWRTNYYNDCVNLMSMIQISGNWWKPEI